jgi:hypothetical protein
MDQWMSEKGDEEDQSIQLKFCPKCKAPVRRSFRYADLVKAKLKDIERVKKMILEEEQKLEGKKETLLYKINKLAERYPEIGRVSSTGYYDNEEDSDALMVYEEEYQEERRFEGNTEDVEDESILDTFTRWLEQRRTMTELSTIENQIQLIKGINKLKRTAKKSLVSSPQVSFEVYEMRDQALGEIDSELRTLQGKIVITFQTSQQELKDIRDEITRVGLKLRLRHLQCNITESKVDTIKNSNHVKLYFA